MVVTQQMLDALKQIGLNLYERKLWTALLSRGTATAGELSSLAKVPHSRTYDVLESLADKGFVMVQNTKPLKYVAIKPIEALERAKKKVMTDADQIAGRITSLQGSSLAKDLESLHKKGVNLVEPGELTGSLRGRHSLHQQLDTLFKDAKKHISIMTSAEGMAELHEKHSDSLKKAAKKGVKVRIAVPAGKNNADIINEMKTFADVRKISGEAYGRFCLVDGSHTLIALTDDKDVHPTQDFSLWTQSDHVASNVLGPMFDALWQKLPSA